VVFLGQLQLAEVGRQEVLHLLVGNLDALGHSPLAHAADDHFAADLLARAFQAQTVTRQRFAELLQRHVVSLGNGAHGLVELFVSDANAGALTNLQLQIFGDQAFQNLLLQYIHRWRIGATLFDGLLDFTHPLLQLALHDDVVIDDRHHAVQWLHLSEGRRRESRTAQQQSAERERAQYFRKLDLHVHGSLGCLRRGKFRSHCRLHRRVP